MIPLHGILLIALLLAGCRQMPTLPVLPVLAPYKIDIQQGNVVTQEMMAKLKPGMTPGQVRFVLGTPLVVDAFHKDRWDYVYSYSKGGTVLEHRRIVIVFQDEKLARIEGDVLPAPAASTDERLKIEKAAPKPVKPAPQDTGPGATLPAQPASNLSTSTGKPVTAGGASADAAGGAAKSGDEQPKDNSREEKPKEERGFFGRMLEKLGF